MAIYLTRKSSLILGIGLIILFFAAGILMLYRSNTSRIGAIESATNQTAQEPEKIPEKLDPTVPVVLNKFHRNQIRDGKKLWEVLAEKGRYIPASNNAELDQAQLYLFRKDGTKVELTAQKALLKFAGTELSQAQVSGQVHMIYNDKVQMRTEDATYDQAAEIVNIPGDVNILTDNIEVSGKNLVVEIQKKEMQLRSDVSTIIQPRGK